MLAGAAGYASAYLAYPVPPPLCLEVEERALVTTWANHLYV